jgi:hypothetical protein
MTEMNAKLRRRPTKWESEAMMKKSRLSPKQILAINKEYERRVMKENREEVLDSLSQKYGRSARQIERYIQKVRKERELEERPTQPEAVTIQREDSRLKIAHYEDIREAIRFWIEKQHRVSAEELSDLWNGKLNAWGVEAKCLPGGERRAILTISTHALCESLQAHLSPPVVKEDFWNTVSKINDMALAFVNDSVKCFAEIASDASAQTGIAINADGWRNTPAAGLTLSFPKTVFDRSMDIHSFTNWAYHAWTVLWPVGGGLVITWLNEGVRLLKRMGYDPVVKSTTWYPTMEEPLLLPRSPTERVVYGNADLNSPGNVSFLLCFGSEQIALLSSPDQIAGCQQVHASLMQKYMSWDKTTRLRQVWAKLDTLSDELSIQLERARYTPSFPGRCSLCP